MNHISVQIILALTYTFHSLKSLLLSFFNLGKCPDQIKQNQQICLYYLRNSVFFNLCLEFVADTNNEKKLEVVNKKYGEAEKKKKKQDLFSDLQSLLLAHLVCFFFHYKLLFHLIPTVSIKYSHLTPAYNIWWIYYCKYHEYGNNLVW